MIHAALKLLDSNENDDDEEVEVEQILDRKEENGKILYLIKWVGFPESENSWEPIKNLENCQNMLNDFDRKLKDKGMKQKEETEKKYGHFEFGDKLKNIVKEKLNSEGRLILEITWEKRQDGTVPKNSIMYSDVLKKHCPQQFVEYLENRLLQMEVIKPLAQKTTADSLLDDDDDSFDKKRQIKKKVRIHSNNDDESVVALDSELNESL